MIIPFVLGIGSGFVILFVGAALLYERVRNE